ncbi:MAG: cupin domain-containing protein [Pseudomonadota bacterium]|nr:cupin domain-containing protein [Pseudomonadota bacterium]
MDQTEFEAELRRDGYDARVSTREPNEIHESHAHGFDARLLILDGEITILCEGDRRTYRPGDSCMMPAGRPHSEYIGPEGVRYVAGRRSAAA